jgi:tetratricopeptide (TPR) repeat protein
MKTKSLISIFVALFCFSAIQAQSVEDVGKIALSVVMPENVDGLNVSQISKLESKITQITTKAGLSASGYNQNFVIYPRFAIYETNVVEGGMQNITVVTAELSLFIKQVNNNLLFSSVAKNLKGSGKTKEIAMTNAIAQIPVSDKAFAEFVAEGKQKIVAYYEQNCDDIVKKADAFSKMQQYEQALGLLMSVPEEVSSCYNKILQKSVDTYKAYQKQHCTEQLQQARTLSAAMNYDEALGVLSEIDPSTECFAEAKTMLKSIENKISAEYKKRWDMQVKIYNDAVALEKQRINAVKEIAVSYYKSQPKSVNYNYIVR